MITGSFCLGRNYFSQVYEKKRHEFTQGLEFSFLCQEDLKQVEQTTTQQQQKQDYRTSPTTTEEVQWSYTDPQGKVQGTSTTLIFCPFLCLNASVIIISRIMGAKLNVHFCLFFS